MIVGSIARRYAKALLGIGTDNKQFERFGKELDSFAATLNGSKELQDVLANPSLPLSKRRAIVEGLIKKTRPSPTVQSFLLLLMNRGRISYLPAIAREYQTMADRHAGRVRARVSSAFKLDLATVTRLKKALEEKTSKKVILEQKVDPDLIGGVVAQIGSNVYDGSIRTTLSQMRQTLLEGKR